jgi:hypothetical protein
MGNHGSNDVFGMDPFVWFLFKDLGVPNIDRTESPNPMDPFSKPLQANVQTTRAEGIYTLAGRSNTNTTVGRRRCEANKEA